MRSRERTEAVVTRLGEAGDGVVATADLLREGVASSSITRLRRQGVLIPVARGVDRVCHQPFGLRSRYRATLVVAGPGAALGLRTAARLHGLAGYEASEEVEVLSRRPTPRFTNLGRIEAAPGLGDDEVTVVDGLPVTTLRRTLNDLCSIPNLDAA